MFEPSPTPDDIQRELTEKLSNKVYSFDAAINKVHEDESYFVCDAGFILRILRGPSLGYEYPAILELYDIDGKLISSDEKSYEPAIYFSSRFQSEIANGKFYLLNEKPSFFPAKNNSFRSEILSRTKVRDRKLKAIGALFYD